MSLSGTKYLTNPTTWGIKNCMDFFNSKECARIELIMQKAFAEWQKYINLDFIQTDKDPRIVVTFHRIDGDRATLAHSTLPFADSLFIHFDVSEDWDLSLEKDYVFSIFQNSIKMYNVALHEIGHVLGLDHSKKLGSIMYPNYSRMIDTISISDLETLTSVYELREGVPLPEEPSWLYIMFNVYYQQIMWTLLMLIATYLIYRVAKKTGKEMQNYYISKNYKKYWETV